MKVEYKKEKDYKNIGETMINLAKELFPLNRSLMGPDIRVSLNKFMNF